MPHIFHFGACKTLQTLSRGSLPSLGALLGLHASSGRAQTARQ